MKFTINITSPPDREELVAEIWDENDMIAEVNQESENLELEIYPGKNPMVLNYDHFIEALIDAKNKLQGS